MVREYQSPGIGKLAEALAKAQGAMGHAKKSADNPFFKSSYADLPAVIDAAKAALADNGLAVSQFTDADENGNVTLVSTLMHSSGEWVRGWYPVRPLKADPQGLGSAVTYARRYSFAALVGIAAADDDDDGNAASGHQTNAGPPPAAKQDNGGYGQRLQEYAEAKAGYVIEVPYLPDGYPDYDQFAAAIEIELAKAKKLNDAAMLKKANAITLNAMQKARPDLFDHLKITFAAYSSKLT